MRYNFNPNSIGIDLHGIYKHKTKINFPGNFTTNKKLCPSLLRDASGLPL